ncbi:hypothetical protein [Gordonia polyisoprenivorans]|uniref:hypothetical protein n=1 Tax=Gordonia polyisoprenivorans TaxID=84595 RepID=UPI001AD6AD1E|nr:hypothetical protein [Gordonia polyisoprenivorans]QTI71293.1 hypothetical protein J6U32_12690 [Gordonia polyisoprenivorans]
MTTRHQRINATAARLTGAVVLTLSILVVVGVAVAAASLSAATDISPWVRGLIFTALAVGATTVIALAATAAPIAARWLIHTPTEITPAGSSIDQA